MTGGGISCDATSDAFAPRSEDTIVPRAVTVVLPVIPSGTCSTSCSFLCSSLHSDVSGAVSPVA